MKKVTGFLIALSFIGIAARAQDRIFNYTYQSNVLGPGQREIEPWATFKWGKSNYRAFEQRFEFEIGLADRLQTSFYFNASTSASGDSALSTESDISFSNEWKFKILDPVADPVGLALYQEYTLGRTEIEWENKLILDKRIGKHILAYNLVGELEWEKESEGTEVETDRELKFENVFGWSYNAAKGWYVGLEARSAGILEDGKAEHFATFAGPTVSYLRDQFWVNASILPKLSGKPENGQTMEARVIFSYSF